MFALEVFFICRFLCLWAGFYSPKKWDRVSLLKDVCIYSIKLWIS